MKLAVAALPVLLAPQLAGADAPADPARASAQLTAAIKARDASAVAKLIADDAAIVGMYFSDPACAKRFGQNTNVRSADIPVFAKCLTQLKLQATTRVSMMSTHALLTVEPGFEIELDVRDGLVRSISFVGAEGPRDTTPTLSAQAFEALRTAGTTNVDELVRAKLAPIVSKVGPVSAWLKVCLDTRGAVTSATVAESHGGADVAPAFEAAAANWKFKPFQLRGTPTAVCSFSLLTYPAAKSPGTEVVPPARVAIIKPKVVKVKDLVQPVKIEKQPVEDYGDPCGVEGGVVEGSVPGGVVGGVPPPPPPPPAPPQTVPPTLLEGQRTKGNKLIMPDDVTKVEIQRAGKDRIIGSFKLCVSATGTVTTVSQLKSTGFAAYDSKIQREMRMWEYKPYQVNGKSVPVCTAVTFIYKQEQPPPPAKP